MNTGRTIVGAVVAYCFVAVSWSMLSDLSSGEAGRHSVVLRLLFLGFVAVGGWALFQGSAVIRWFFVVGLLVAPAVWIVLGEDWRLEVAVVLVLHTVLSACLAAVPGVTVFLEEQRSTLAR